MTFSGVLDANAVIGLSKGGVFASLALLYAPLYISTTVAEEVIQQGQGRAGVTELGQAIGIWVTEVTPDPLMVQQLTSPRSIADREVLVAARENAVDHVLTDDGPLRRQALLLGLGCLSVPEVVVVMKTQGLIAEVRSVLDRMRREGYGIAQAVYQAALHSAGE